MPEVVLETKDLVKHFPITRGIVFQTKIGSVRAVDGVNLTLHKGETLGVVGESGCGKSTFAKLLVEGPDAGPLRMRRLDERYAEKDQVGFIAFLRSDSNTTNSAAIKYLVQE